MGVKGGCAVLPAFTRVSLYQPHRGLMQHDRTSFHPRVWANALKCYNASDGAVL